MTDLPGIFHEKQDGLLCAQHCLNNLLQGSYFMATDLSEIARQLDFDELKAMVDGDPGSRERIEAEFNKEGSPNYDDTGFFSLTVIEKALQVFGVALIPIASTDLLAVEAKQNPQLEKAYVLNLNEHWYALRKFGDSDDRWYDLNSMNNNPKHISKTYLGMLLDQMETEGYSIFVAKGEIPETEADQIAKMIPVPPAEALKPLPISDGDTDLERALKLSRGDYGTDQDAEFQQALKASMDDVGADAKTMDMAIAASISNFSAGTSKNSSTPRKVDDISAEEMRRRRLEKFG